MLLLMSCDDAGCADDGYNFNNNNNNSNYGYNNNSSQDNSITDNTAKYSGNSALVGPACCIGSLCLLAGRPPAFLLVSACALLPCMAGRPSASRLALLLLLFARLACACVRAYSRPSASFGACVPVCVSRLVGSCMRSRPVRTMVGVAALAGRLLKQTRCCYSLALQSRPLLSASADKRALALTLTRPTLRRRQTGYTLAHTNAHIGLQCKRKFTAWGRFLSQVGFIPFSHSNTRLSHSSFLL